MLSLLGGSTELAPGPQVMELAQQQNHMVTLLFVFKFCLNCHFISIPPFSVWCYF